MYRNDIYSLENRDDVIRKMNEITEEMAEQIHREKNGDEEAKDKGNLTKLYYRQLFQSLKLQYL